MAFFKTAVIFLILGSNYLLPFNTLLNLRDFYENELDMNMSTTAYISILNGVYQLSAISVNTLILFPHGRRIFTLKHKIMNIATLTLIVCLFILAVLSYINYFSKYYVLISFILAALLSSFSSVLDAINLELSTEQGNEKCILAYTTGINVSGTIHAFIYLIIQILNSNKYSFISACYLTTSAICFIPMFYFYNVSFKPIYSEEEITHVEDFEENRQQQQQQQRQQYQPLEKLSILKKTCKYNIIIFLNFVLTLFAYPTLFWYSSPPFIKHIFNTIFVLILFNAFALIGNIIALKFPTCKISTLILLLLVRVSVMQIYLFYDNLCFRVLNMFIFAFFSAYIASGSFYGAATHVLAPNASILDRAFALRLVNLFLSLGLGIGSLCIYIFTSKYTIN